MVSRRRSWIVGPAWQGTAPAGVIVLHSATNAVWALARTYVAGASAGPRPATNHAAVRHESGVLGCSRQANTDFGGRLAILFQLREQICQASCRCDDHA
ncbi:DUF1254 domain-containing protein [Paraburkholderia sp. RP-4-7]|uniref:DUF1254 domain-containing protein n=1 Tax=Paraburkholderia polaris TaxID=2728848 RepID=A0A848IPB1_9BURK|nr:DUF1254 domain-containing protein [Paraburkholderia polaris]